MQYARLRIQIRESQYHWSWKGPLKVIWLNTHAQARPHSVGCPGPCPGDFWIPPGMESPQPFQATCASEQRVNPIPNPFIFSKCLEILKSQKINIGFSTGPTRLHKWRQSLGKSPAGVHKTTSIFNLISTHQQEWDPHKTLVELLFDVAVETQ